MWELFLAFLCVFIAGNNAKGYIVIPDKHYGPDSLQVCDIYIPDSAHLNPIVILVHGGAWHGGDKSNFNHIALHLVQEGYVVVNINYRLAPSYHYPDIPADVALAIKWAKYTLGDGPGDSSKIAILGGSAGAHLAALVSLTPERPWVPAAFPGVSTRLSGCIGISGVYDFDLLPPDGDSVVLSFLGDSSYWDEAEPTNCVDTTDTVRFLLIHGTADSFVNWWQSDSLHSRLIANGCHSSLIHLEGENHASPINNFDSLSAPHVDTFLQNLWNTPIEERNSSRRGENSISLKCNLVNPAHLDIYTDHATFATIVLLNSSGRKIKELYKGDLLPGKKRIQLNLTRYPAGRYYILLTDKACGKENAKSFLLIK